MRRMEALPGWPRLSRRDRQASLQRAALIRAWVVEAPGVTATAILERLKAMASRQVHGQAGANRPACCQAMARKKHAGSSSRASL